MADKQLETVEPDPAASSLANDDTVVSVKDESTVHSTEAQASSTSAATTTEDLKKSTNGAAPEDSVNEPGQGVTATTTGHNVSKQDNTAFESQRKDSEIGESSNTQERKSHADGKASRDHGRSSNRGDKFRSNNDRPRKDYSGNVKSDLTSQEESSDPVAIRKQVEFYFSDSNLHSDKFLFSKVEGAKNNAVPVSVIHSFKRMRHFQPRSAIISALKESTVLNVVEDDSSIQRKVPLTEEIQNKPHYEVQKVYEDRAMSRSVYVKGFGEEQPSTQFDIEAFFTPYGPTNSVRLRRSPEKLFKGSVFVEFDSEETQKKFLAMDPAPKWNGKDLIIKSKKQYCDEKVDDITAGKVKPNLHQRDDRSKRNRGENGDDRDWRERRKEDQKNGFKDRRGRGHKGFGSSGRGRGGGRGHRGSGGRDRNDESERQRKEHEVPKVGVSTEETPADAKATPETLQIAEEGTAGNANINSSCKSNESPVIDPPEMSKKRARDDDTGTEEQGNAKKLDTKSES